MTLIDDLIKAIKDEDSELDPAIEAIVAAKEEQTAVAQIDQQILNAQQAIHIRHRAIYALSNLKHPTAVDVLGKTLAADTDASIRRICTSALEQLDGLGLSAPYFQQALKNSQPADRKSILFPLGNTVRKLVTNRQKDANNSQHYLDTLAKLELSTLETLLKQPLSAQATEGISVPAAAATALGWVGGAPAIPILCQQLANEERKQRQSEALSEEELNRLNDEQRAQLEQDAATETVMLNAVVALRDIGDPTAVPCLGTTLRNNLNFRVRRQAASAIGSLQEDDGIPHLARAFLRDDAPQVRRIAEKALTRIANWQKKAAELIQLLREVAEQRSKLDIDGIIKAINPPQGEGQYPLTDYLIEQAVAAEDERLVALLANLIVASADSSKTLAGERIDAFREAMGTSEEKLQPLRVEIGGKALDPILGRLEKNLEEYFQKPITRLNDETSSVWRQTIFIAQTGFALRALMSFVLFCVGMYLVIDSYRLFKVGDLDTAQFAGAGTSFIGGLGVMLTMVFTGPLKEIRKAVNDVGVANTAFIAYIHRVLQVSHTFSYFYLQGAIDFAKLKEAGNLIEDTMDDTVKVLHSSYKSKDDRKNDPPQV